MIQKLKKIIFLQPAYAHYREDLFSILSKRHKIHFLFERSSAVYPGNHRPENLDHTIIEKRFRIISIGLLYYLFKIDGDIVLSSISGANRTFICFLYAAIFRKKFILWILEWRQPSYPKSLFKRCLKKIKFWLAQKIILKSNALIVGGAAAGQFAIQLGKKPEDIFTAAQCSKDLWTEPSALTKQDDKAAKFTFLFLGRIIAWKGLDILIKAFYLLKQKREDVCLLIAGDGPSREYCLGLATALGIQDIEFTGSVDPDRTSEQYSRADVFVLPSYELDSYYEEWGLVINEAMSMQLPVISTTAVGASFDMIQDGINGFVVQENNVDELFRAMDKILECDLDAMGKKSRQIFEEKNSYARMANGFTNAAAYVDE